jgi:8-oxo-dGTP pyrophosphatase MutT (NUDIX family)
MAPIGRNVEYKPEIIAAAKRSAVLIMIYPLENGFHVPFIRRKDYKGVHSSQIGFPGGKVEPEDEDLSATALRETAEEIGADPTAIQLLGKLTDLYIPVSNYLVSPFVGWSDTAQSFTPEESEVEEVLEFGVEDLFDRQNKRDAKVRVAGGLMINAPSFIIKNEIIWGATAMMLNEFVSLMNLHESND